MHKRPLRDLTILFKGAGDLASGVASRLFRANFRRIVMLEIPSPMAITCYDLYDDPGERKCAPWNSQAGRADEPANRCIELAGRGRY